MKTFRFSLQAVQTLRQRQEQIALELYAAQLRKRHDAAAQLAAAQQHLETAWQTWRLKLQSGCPAAQATHAQNHYHTLQDVRDRCAQDLIQIEHSLKIALEQMLAARQRRQAVDQYYKNQRRRFDADYQRDQQKILDELAHRATPAISFVGKKVGPADNRPL